MTINVLFIAAEADPFIKVGGLGDVAGALPYAIDKISKNLPNNSKIDIRLVIPYHFAIKNKNLETQYLGKFDVESKKGSETCKVYLFEKSELPVYFLDGDPIDEKSPVYSIEPIKDGYKFVFFSLAALSLAKFLNWKVDILHANDWHTATAIYALKTSIKKPSFLTKTKTLLSLHNLPFMGFGVQQALFSYRLPPTKNKALPEWARHAPLPLGLLHADKIIAVSPHYAQEILTPEFGCGLDPFLITRKDALDGILNGLDTDTWDPSKDKQIAHNFTLETLSIRKINKQNLMQEFGLQQNNDVPLLTLISRMDPQKGIDIALRGIKYLKDYPWQAIILGTGIPYIEDMAWDLAKQYPDRVRSIIDFDSNLAHRLYAGADIFLMPSRYEPCGLSQMIAMRYGCVPVARATGGLVNTIKHISRTVNGGTGYLFKQPYPSAFASELLRALTLYQKPSIWRQIQKNGMRTEFSWESSAQKYINTYQDLITDL